MEAVIKIIEENIPEVISRSLMIYDWVVRNVLLQNLYFFLTVSCQLNCLNLSNNRIHKLDELADLVAKVPQLKTLNLSHNEVALVFLLLFSNDTLLHLCCLHRNSPVAPLWIFSVEVWSRAGQDKRPEAGGAVAEQESSLWPLQGSSLLHQVSKHVYGMRKKGRRVKANFALWGLVFKQGCPQRCFQVFHTGNPQCSCPNSHVGHVGLEAACVDSE